MIKKKKPVESTSLLSPRSARDQRHNIHSPTTERNEPTTRKTCDTLILTILLDAFCTMCCPSFPFFCSPSAAAALPVRVNLPVDLGGGFTMMMCDLRGGQSVSDFTRNLIAMLQNTNAIVLRAREYGLTPRVDRDEDGLDEHGAPPVFLKPDSLLADAFRDEDELDLDLRRLKPLKKQEPVDPNSAAASLAGPPPPPPFRMPTLPVPPAHTVLHYTALAKLKRLKPPADAPPEVLVVSTLVPPCSLPEHLARSLPQGMQTLSLIASLQARASSASTAGAVAGKSNGAIATPASSSSHLTSEEKKAAKAAEQLQRKIDEYSNHVYDLLLARGIGEDPQLTLQLAAARASARAVGAGLGNKDGDRIATSTTGDGDDDESNAPPPEERWGGWDEHIEVRAQDLNKVEVPLIFVSTKPLPTPVPKKFDVTTDCFVITTQRVVQVSAGRIIEDLALGSDSGNILKLPKTTDDGTPGMCPIHLLVKNAIEIEREEAILEARENGTYVSGMFDEAGDGYDDDDPSVSRRARARSRGGGGPKQRTVSFYVPNPDIAGFIEEYLMYFQEKTSLESQLGLIEQARLDRINHYATERSLRGWTVLLKSLVGPIIFGPLRQPVYENSIKQVLAKVQQMDLKQVKITSLKLVEFRIPELDADALLNSKDGDQIPSLRLADYAGHPHHTYTFDIFWSAPSFYLKLEISGKKIVTFKLELEMRGVEVRGSLRLRSSPYEPEKAAVSFVSVPQISFGVGSHVIIGSVKLPFQRAIEKIIYQQIQAAIENGLKENVVGDKWQSIYYEKSGLSLQLDRWWSMAQYPFKYDGTDDEDMMSLALVVTTQAEKSLSATVKEMKANRDKMENCLGHQRGGVPAAAGGPGGVTAGGGHTAPPSSAHATPSHSRQSTLTDSPDRPQRKKSTAKPPPAEVDPMDSDEDDPRPPKQSQRRSVNATPNGTSARRKSKAERQEEPEEEE